jgi:ATP-dependent RNA circularization protein (DNA/RNA ligase family)
MKRRSGHKVKNRNRKLRMNQVSTMMKKGREKIQRARKKKNMKISQYQNYQKLKFNNCIKDLCRGVVLINYQKLDN